MGTDAHLSPDLWRGRGVREDPVPLHLADPDTVQMLYEAVSNYKTMREENLGACEKMAGERLPKQTRKYLDKMLMVIVADIDRCNTVLADLAGVLGP